MIGRGMRVAEGKTECKIIDIAASLDKVGDISAAPSLEGLDLSLFDDINSETIENDVKGKVRNHTMKHLNDKQMIYRSIHFSKKIQRLLFLMQITSFSQIMMILEPYLHRLRINIRRICIISHVTLGWTVVVDILC